MLPQKHAARTFPRCQVNLRRHLIRFALILRRIKALNPIIRRSAVLTGFGAHGAVLPAVVVAPAVRQGDDPARLPDGLEGVQGIDHDLALQGGGVGFAGGAAQGEVQVDGAGWIDRAGDGVGAR